ncbi:hypothetical protein CHS0354_019270 [Potamilus streckersoni]|uniref:Uncharacterized protein n=1 Tax=Potamilus streckersoni TaxID=2493646 RepID=A0AAE0RM37_9BIVA|nr:hypothetical protein CHS0354_019270 [Potamilus streckersoni]
MLNECANHPCKNGGSCVNQINGYSCTCPAGYVGHNCTIEIDECASSPCKNGGSCENLVNRYICICPSGFAGHDCSTDCFFKSTLYVGQVSQTIDNVTCDRWDVHLLPGTLLASKLPDPKLSDAANFCRDPDGKGHPWCYISGNGLKTWEFCDVLFCQGLYY